MKALLAELLIRIWQRKKPIRTAREKFRNWRSERRVRKGKEPLPTLKEDEIMLRTSTGAGLAGIAVNILLQIMQAFPVTAELAASPEVAAALTTAIMWIVARIWKTPENPGTI